jgi:hypothetical protein
MAFQPRLNDDGRVCCARWDNGFGTGEPLPPTNPCDKCRAYFAKQNITLLEENNTVAFKPRLKSDGSPCCHRVTDDGHLAFPRTPPCAPCAAYFDEIGRRQEQRAAELRALEEDDCTPPDPFADGIAKLRQEDAARRKTVYTPPPTELHYDENEIPDPYAADLDKMRRERSR